MSVNEFWRDKHENISMIHFNNIPPLLLLLPPPPLLLLLQRIQRTTSFPKDG